MREKDGHRQGSRTEEKNVGEIECLVLVLFLSCRLELLLVICNALISFAQLRKDNPTPSQCLHRFEEISWDISEFGVMN